jgi:hypothetical protein
VTTPGATFSEPITLNIYSVGVGNAVGSLLGTDTQTFTIPYRPSTSDPSLHSAQGCTGDQWYDATDNACYTGLANNITFGLSSRNLILPNSVIYGIAYNTSDYGSAPYGDGTACHAAQEGCGYDSLNVELSQDPTNVSLGSDTNPGTVYWNTNFAPEYCDNGAGGTGTFRIDGRPDSQNCWDGGANTGWSVGAAGTSPYFVPAVQFNAGRAPAVTTQPASQTYTSGQTLTFTAAASGDEAPTLQWQYSVNGGSSWSNLSGATSSPLSAGPLTNFENHWEVRAVFTNSAGSATSHAATMTFT